MENRNTQYLAAGLAALLVILVGGVLFVVLTRPSEGPSPSATPTSVAFVTPSPTLAATPTPLPSPTSTLEFTPEITALSTPEMTPQTTLEITPEITPEITAPITPEPTAPPTVLPTPTPTATPTPTPTPTAITPTSPRREFRMQGVGLDPVGELTSIQRFVQFDVDGPSNITGELSNSTGRVRICLYRGNQVESQTCRNLQNGTFTMAVGDAGATSWTFTLIGRDAGESPVVDFSVGFNATQPQVDLSNFRYQGQPRPSYNGFSAAVDTSGSGQLRVDGGFDPGQQHEWHVVISEAGVGSVEDETGGPSNAFSVSHAVSTETSYLIQVSNPNDTEEPGPVFLHSTVSWS